MQQSDEKLYLSLILITLAYKHIHNGNIYEKSKTYLFMLIIVFKSLFI